MAQAAAPHPCRKCGSRRVYPSRLRSPIERLRRVLTDKQPYRCHACNWRAWDVIHVPAPKGPDGRPDDLRTGRTSGAPVTAADLDRLDTR